MGCATSWPKVGYELGDPYQKGILLAAETGHKGQFYERLGGEGEYKHPPELRSTRASAGCTGGGGRAGVDGEFEFHPDAV